MSINTNIKRPVLRYHGGKFLLAKWIVSHFPKHRIYVEPFGGGGSVLMRKEPSYAEVYNDKWDIVWNVFNVLRDPVQASALQQKLELTPFSRTEFNRCGDVDLHQITDPVEKARLTIFRSFAGFGSASTNAKYSTGFRANSNRSGTTPAHDWQSYPKHITSFVERLRGVVIENKDYKSVIAQHDTPQTLIYLDPPYVHSTRNMKRGNAAYVHEFSDQDHIDMASRVNQVEAMVIISGYACELYQELFNARGGWTMLSKDTYADGAKKRTECLWFNERAYSRYLLNNKVVTS